LPVHLKAQIIRELDRLEVLLAQLKTVETERDALLKRASDEAASPAAMARLKAIGPETAAVLWSEGLFRQFDNPRQVAAYAGLANAIAERLDRPLSAASKLCIARPNRANRA
jgi:transposase